jgi:lipopolysaccharide-induced tumor necrosis factor-alpha factor
MHDPNNPQMAQHPQGIPQQPQVVYMQQTPTGMTSPTGHPQQQQVPMQQIHPQQSQPMAGQRTYQNVTPLASLGRSAAPVDCPACGQRGMTKISHLAGNYAQYVFLLPVPKSLSLGFLLRGSP